MKKLNKVALIAASLLVAGAAFANGSTTNSDNWRSGVGNLQWKIGNASALCWRNAGWTPATAAPGCDGAIAVAAAAPAPAAVVAPVKAAPAAPAAAPAPAPAPVAAKPAPAPAAAPAPAPMPEKKAPKRRAKQDRN